MLKRTLIQRVLSVAVAMISTLPATAEEPAKEADSKITVTRTQQKQGLNASVRGRSSDASGQWAEGTFSFRVYEGFNRFGPVLGHVYPAFGADVTAEIENCPDGRIRIRSMNIGGLIYRQDDTCKNVTPSSKVTVTRSQGGTVIEKAENVPQETKDPDARKIILCDPQTWDCRTETQ